MGSPTQALLPQEGSPTPMPSVTAPLERDGGLATAEGPWPLRDLTAPCGYVLYKQTGYKVTLKRYILFHRQGREGHHARAPSFSPWEPQAASFVGWGLGGLQATGSGQGRARKRTAPSKAGANGGITRRLGNYIYSSPKRLSWAKSLCPSGDDMRQPTPLAHVSCNGRPGSPFTGYRPPASSHCCR